MFTAILDFLYPGKKPGEHTEYLRKYIFCSLLSRKVAPVMTNISDLALKLRAQLLVFPWHHDPSTRHVTHAAHDIMRNTPNVFKEYSTFLFTGEMFRETTFFSRNSSFTVLGTGKCVSDNRGLLNIAPSHSPFSARRAISFFLSKFSSAPCDSFGILVSDWTLWCFLCWFHNMLEESTLIK